MSSREFSQTAGAALDREVIVREITSLLEIVGCSPAVIAHHFGDIDKATDALISLGCKASTAADESVYSARTAKVTGQLVAPLEALLDERGERSPTEPGGYAGDVFYGDPEDRTRPTHRWDGRTWSGFNA